MHKIITLTILAQTVCTFINAQEVVQNSIK